MHRLLAILILTTILTVQAFANENPTASQTKGQWDQYYQNTLNATEPYKTLILAQKYFEIEDQRASLAVDLGTGTGRDALFLLKKGWKVHAIDAEPLALEILLNRASEHLTHLEVNISPFATMVLPNNVALINASYSLPFCSPEEFPDCWQNIIDHLAIGGRFAGQFFGERDEWATNPSLTFHSQEKLLQLFEEHFTIEYLQIEEGLLPTAAGPMKHWHVYHIVARKIK